MQLFRFTLWIQTIYYLVTAVWALVHMESFMKVTGAKTDVWLVKTVAILLVAISLSFLTALFSRSSLLPTVVLAASCCIALTAIDCYYALNGTISKIYVADAVVELILLAGWLIIILGKKIQ